jgi:hypothetical protein
MSPEALLASFKYEIAGQNIDLIEIDRAEFVGRLIAICYKNY